MFVREGTGTAKSRMTTTRVGIPGDLILFYEYQRRCGSVVSMTFNELFAMVKSIYGSHSIEGTSIIVHCGDDRLIVDLHPVEHAYRIWDPFLKHCEHFKQAYLAKRQMTTEPSTTKLSEAPSQSLPSTEAFSSPIVESVEFC